MARDSVDRDTRSAILDVAEAQFGAKGFSGTHLQSIAEAVGVQKTALYYYFESKEALYVAVLEHMLETFEQVFLHESHRKGITAETLVAAIDDFNDVLARNPNFAPIIMRIFIDRIQIDNTVIRRTVERIVDPLLKFYAAGVAAGTFRKMSARHALLTVVGAASFYYASGGSGAAIVGVEDLFDEAAVDWRRREFRTLVLGGLLPDDEGS